MKSYICSSYPNKMEFFNSHDMNVNARPERWKAFYKAGCGHLSLHVNVLSGVHIFHVTFTASSSSYHTHFVKRELQRMNLQLFILLFCTKHPTRVVTYVQNIGLHSCGGYHTCRSDSHLNCCFTDFSPVV